MSKLTLLKIVNNTLMAMEATQVSTIDETLESTSVARIAEEVFYEMVSQGEWPHLNQIKKAVSVADSERPNYLEIPSEIKDIRSVWYNQDKLIYNTPEEFLNISKCRDLNSDNIVQVYDYNGTTFSIVNDHKPTYFTILSETYLVTDSYDAEDSVTLMGSKCDINCSIIPAWSEADDFVPDLTDNMFPTYLALVKRAAFIYLRRDQSIKDERAAIAGLGRLYRRESKLKLSNGIKNYGR